MTVNVEIADSVLRTAAGEGMDAFVEAVVNAIKDAVGGELNAETMQQLNADQITLWGYHMFREEVMEGGFLQLIYIGLGDFIFMNPFAKAMREWGLKDFGKLVYEGRALYEKYHDELCREFTEEEYNALCEQYPEFDDLDDKFVSEEENYTEAVARYVDEHLEKFVTVKG